MMCIATVYRELYRAHPMVLIAIPVIAIRYQIII